MRSSVIKAKWARHEPVLCTQLHLTDPSIFELTSLMGFDGIWMDMEHHAYSLETAASLIRAARVGSSDVMARAARGEFARMARLLEAGAQGIMYPRCQTASEARELIDWIKFAPLGRRGFDGGNPDMPYCTMPMAEYVRVANEQTFVVVQLEDSGSIEQAEAIGAVPGVDVLFLGPGDFSVLGGFPGDFEDPRIEKAMQRVAKAACNTGKHWGTVASSPSHCKTLIEMGATLICHSSDILILKEGLTTIQESFEAMGFSFNGQMTRVPGKVNAVAPVANRERH